LPTDVGGSKAEERYVILPGPCFDENVKNLVSLSLPVTAKASGVALRRESGVQGGHVEAKVGQPQGLILVIDDVVDGQRNRFDLINVAKLFHSALMLLSQNKLERLSSKKVFHASVGEYHCESLYSNLLHPGR
jgi:hypothetical protein